MDTQTVAWIDLLVLILVYDEGTLLRIKQTLLNATTVVRTLGNDTIVIALNPRPTMSISIPFADGTQIRNAYSGETTVVQNGRVTLQQPTGYVALIEKYNRK